MAVVAMADPNERGRPGEKAAPNVSTGNASLAEGRLSEPDAARLTTRIQLRLGLIADNVEAVVPLIEQARVGDAHLALGFRSWTEYVSEKFGGALARLGKAERLPFVELMARQGMSTRAIASVVGVSNATVSRDLAGVTDATPGQLTRCRDCGTPLEWERRTCLNGAHSGRGPDGEPRSVVDVASSTANNNVVGIDGKTYHRPRADQPSPDVSVRDAHEQLTKFLVWARKTRRVLNDGVSLTAAGVDFVINDEMQQTMNGALDDLAAQLSVIKASVNAGSFDEQLSDLLDGHDS